MPSGPAADTTGTLSEQCIQAMDMAVAASEASLPEDVAVSAEALEASAVVDSEAVALPEAFD